MHRVGERMGSVWIVQRFRLVPECVEDERDLHGMTGTEPPIELGRIPLGELGHVVGDVVAFSACASARRSAGMRQYQSVWTAENSSTREASGYQAR